MELLLRAKEDMDCPAGLGAEVPIMRFGGRARVQMKRMQLKPSMASEDTVNLLSVNIP